MIESKGTISEPLLTTCSYKYLHFFILASQPGQIEDLGLFNKRHSPMRRSARAAVGHHYESKGHLMRAKPAQLYLFPINFEIPHPDGKPPFVGREWLFHEIRMVSF